MAIALNALKRSCDVTIDSTRKLITEGKECQNAKYCDGFIVDLQLMCDKIVTRKAHIEGTLKAYEKKKVFKKTLASLESYIQGTKEIFENVKVPSALIRRVINHGIAKTKPAPVESQNPDSQLPQDSATDGNAESAQDSAEHPA